MNKALINKYGIPAQLDKMVEEILELKAELLDPNTTKEKVLTEIADSLNTTMQLQPISLMLSRKIPLIFPVSLLRE